MADPYKVHYTLLPIRNPGTRPRSDITDYDFENVAELIKIKYPEMATLGRTAPPPSSSKAAARVRVQAGDKGVSPIKSKPKKRKNLTAQEQTGLSMASVEWSDKVYPVEDLVQYHGGRFPVLVKVTEGYKGDLDVEYTSGVVVQLQGHGIQERLIATDPTGRRLSIPLEYPVDVTVVNANTREVRSLESAVRKYNLPLCVQVVSAREGMRIGQANILGQTINIIDTHEDTYVKGNSIVDGWIDQSDIAIIPSFLRVHFAVAVGMRDATDDEWDDYRNMFARSVRHLYTEFGRISGWPGVIIQDGRTGGLASLGSPPNSPHLGGRENTYQNSPHMTRALPREDLYQNLPPKSPGAKRRPNTVPKNLRVLKTLSPPARESSSSNETESSIHMIEVDIHTNSLPSEPEIELVTLEPPPSREQNREQNWEQNRERRPYENVSLPPQPPHHRQAKRDQHFTDGESADELDVDQMFERVLVVAEEEEEKRRTLEREQHERSRNQARASRDQERSHDKDQERSHEKERVSGSITTNSNTVMNLVNRLNSNASANVAERPDVNQNRQHTGPAPRAVVPPTRQISNNNNNCVTDTNQLGPFVVSVNVGTLKPENNNIEVSKTGITNIPRYNTLEEVPRELDSLTVEEVCQCLDLLNMSGHVPKFRHKQVDGKLMGDMKESVLQTEFNFTPFNASKLMRFARGWRPRFT